MLDAGTGGVCQGNAAHASPEAEHGYRSWAGGKRGPLMEAGRNACRLERWREQPRGSSCGLGGGWMRGGCGAASRRPRCATSSPAWLARLIRMRMRMRGNRRNGPEPAGSGPRRYSTASFSITTLRCAVTSLCNLIGTVNSPRALSGSCTWIFRRSISKPFLPSASAISPEVTEPKS
jgi:hypothetical protein